MLGRPCRITGLGNCAEQDKTIDEPRVTGRERAGNQRTHRVPYDGNCVVIGCTDDGR